MQKEQAEQSGVNASATALMFSGTSQSLVMNIPMDAKQDRGSVPSS
jgi:hypothetical protein